MFLSLRYWDEIDGKEIFADTALAIEDKVESFNGI